MNPAAESIFRRRQPRVVFGACPPWDGDADLASCLLDARAAEADCFACQASLSADGVLFAGRERAWAGIRAADGALPRALESLPARALEGRRDVMEASHIMRLAGRLSLPLALLAPWRAAGDGNLRRRLLAALRRALDQTPRRTPLLLASSDTELLASAPGAEAGLARGLLASAAHSCDMSHLMREARADICVLPLELASDCRLCGLREGGVCTLILGAGSPRDILRLSISGADGFVCADPGPLLALFRRRSG